jgi:mono/diheme cytochrome c family protein
MPLITMIFLIALSLLGCSQVNRESQDYYHQKSSADPIMRHGIVPIEQVATSQKPSMTFDAIKANAGEKVYQKNCLECHGPKGEGNGERAAKEGLKPRNLIEIVRQVPEFKFYISVSQWKGQMPGWKNALDEKELEAIGHYLKKLAQ